MLEEMVEIQKKIGYKRTALKMNDKYLKRPEEGRNYFNISISNAEKENEQLNEEIDELNTEYNKLLKELIRTEADFEMIYEIYSAEIDEEVESEMQDVCKTRYTRREIEG